MMKPPPIKTAVLWNRANYLCRVSAEMKPSPIKTTPIVRQITYVEAVCYLIALPLVIAWNVLLCVARISETEYR